MIRMYDLIRKKRDGEILTEEEIREMIQEYVGDRIPDYQMSAMLMAIYFNGMTDEELAVLTDAMARSGDMVDLSEIPGIKVDKHSTGGVGDKTTLIACPIAASCGVKIAKMSGRGLGHTGGTVDKLDAIPGYQTSLNRKTFMNTVKDCGISLIGQSGNLAPADKKLYALRDVTATVESIPLIAASIMSKKLAAGSDCILLDVKTGSGAFMKNEEDALKLADKMQAIGRQSGRQVAALITDMDIPLGRNIGNALEVREAIDTLKGQGPEDLTEICLALAAHMMHLANLGSLEECRNMAVLSIEDGSALQTLAHMVACQGGDPTAITEEGKLKISPYSYELKAKADGWITHMNTEEIGEAACMLGAGRATKDSSIDYGAGIHLCKKTGDKLAQGDVMAILYAGEEALLLPAAERFEKAIELAANPPEKKPLILASIDKNGKIENYNK